MRNLVVFRDNLHSWHKFYTTTGRDGRDKFQVCRCAHIILTGSMVEVVKGSDEAEFAKKALFSRHPVMPDWPKNHGWFFAKLNITNVIVLDFFGGAITVPLEDYFNAKVDPDM